MVRGLDLFREHFRGFQDSYVLIDDVPIMGVEYILPFKAKAWLDLSQRKQDGENVDSKVIKKHRNDVFRLSVLLFPSQQVELADSIRQDVAAFLSAMAKEDGLNLKDFGVEGSLEELLEMLHSIYQLEL